MNLEEKLNSSLDDILKSSGYIFEIIHNKKKQSNLVTGTNNQLINPTITTQLSNSIAKFDDILNDAISKFNDTKWCVELILENKQKQEELKLKEEEEKQRKIKEQDEKRRHEEEEARKRKLEEEENATKAKKEKEERAKIEELKRQKELQEQKNTNKPDQENNNSGDNDNFDNFMSPSFEFNLNDLPKANDQDTGIPNPSDILSTISYNGLTDSKTPNIDKGGTNNSAPNNNDLDLDMNNLLGNDDLILDGLNISILDQGFDDPSKNDDGNNGLQDDEFDVDNFLNQFGGD